MITTIYIKNIDGVKDFVFEQKRNQDNGRFRSSFFYRGMPDQSFSLTTSLAEIVEIRLRYWNRIR